MSKHSSDQIPAFILEFLEEYEADELRRIAEYADGERRASEDVPERVVEAFSMQDSSVVEAAGNYARSLAENEAAEGTGTTDADTNRYFELAERMIDHESEVLGQERSIELARTVDGLEVDSQGNVLDMTREEVTVIADLVDRYIEQLGKVTEIALQQITRDFRDELELPDNLT
jgi:hypothetical protein